MRLSLLKGGLSKNLWMFFKTTAVANEESHCTEGRMVEPVSPIHLFIRQIIYSGPTGVWSYALCWGFGDA